METKLTDKQKVKYSTNNHLVTNIKTMTMDTTTHLIR